MSVGCSRKTLEEVKQLRETIVTSGKQQIPIVSQFIRIFPSAGHFVTYVTQREGTPVWNSVAGVNQRYVVTLQIPIAIDESGRKVTATGKWTLQINEVVLVQMRPDGGSNITYGEQFSVDEAAWAAVVRSGNLDAAVKLNSGRPVESFSEVIDYAPSSAPKR
jgi:hypothetical protein